jgi:hypothetical protein
MKRTNQYEEIQMIVDSIELNDFPKLKEFVSLLHSAQLLNESWKNMLLRECMSLSKELVIHTADPELISVSDATILAWSVTGLDARQWQHIYKRSLLGDIEKLLD